MRCPHCGQERFTKVTLDLDGGDTIDFYSCRNCEEKWWERNGNVIVLDDVFTLPERVRARRAGLYSEYNPLDL